MTYTLLILNSFLGKNMVFKAIEKGATSTFTLLLTTRAFQLFQKRFLSVCQLTNIWLDLIVWLKMCPKEKNSEAKDQPPDPSLDFFRIKNFLIIYKMMKWK